ncbi:MAG: hypothetical protein HY872_03285 [Chloroflexi bacterium]|nr:hypothetical protein [Chloroflexota bacterium]MBI4315738.1 hypothetical protein [Chloroflexota bacterium]MBI5290883.1 hypothetical protein [Chloroflexota bacterium]MBI5829552.1 hypothetical protein [Chloroflexota bacterium]
MRVLLDECLPRKLKNEFVENQTATVPDMGWAGKKNGELIHLAAGEFQAFITIDQNLTFQQNLATSTLAVVMFVAPDSRLETLKPLVPGVEKALRTAQPGDVIHIGY